MFARIDTRPRCTRIVRTIDAATFFWFLFVLIGIARKNLIGVTRIYQDAGEIPKGEISTPARPMLAAILRHVKRLSGPHVDERRALRVLHDDIYRRSGGNGANLLPGFSRVVRNEDSAGSSSHQNHRRIL